MSPVAKKKKMQKSPKTSTNPKRVFARGNSSDESRSKEVRNMIKPLDELTVHNKRKYALIKTTNGLKSHMGASTGKVLAEIKRLQRSTNVIFPKLSFARVVREISQQYGEFKFQGLALEALQEAVEIFLMGFISDSYQLTKHRKRQTLSAEDMQLLHNLLDPFIPALSSH